jgi:release factor glutamine methyltransferase
MTLKEFQLFFSEELLGKYPKSEIDSFFTICIEEQLNLQRIDIVLKPDFIIDEANISTLKKVINRLQKEEPIQYIFGTTEFFGLPFSVNEHTLIPRPETEELVAWIINEVKSLNIESISKKESKKSLTILDIGTGSGCIAISLKKELPYSKVFAIDVSEEAIKTAKKNAILNNTDINFIEMNILKAEKLPQDFDIIVSNPPYVRELEKKEIKKNVLDNEPHLALFVSDNNPLIFYKKIAELAKNHLSEKGKLFFEINQYLGNETKEMLSNTGFSSVILKKDIFKNDRMIKAE